MKKKACKQCKIIVDGSQCPLCKGDQFVLNWKGRLNILDVSKSLVAKKISVTANGEYAIKVT